MIKTLKVILFYLQKITEPKGKKFLANKQKPNKHMSENPLFIYK